MTTTAGVATINPVSTSTGSYRYYALGLLTFVYVLSFLDRQILSILIQPIKQDLGLSDTQLGFISGAAFALFYTLFSIPMAVWSDRRSRSAIIAVVLAAWSLMTALCGLAVGFFTLLLARIGVAIGEAGAGPAAQALIADYFAPKERSSAMGVYYLGVPIGTLIGLLAGGWISEWFGWRTAFFVVGLPGVLIAALVWLTLREPPRGLSEGLRAAETAPSVKESLAYLWACKSFRHLSFAAALQAFVGYGTGTWMPAFLIRSHGMSIGEVGSWLALLVGVGAGAGALLGGLAADRLARRDERWNLWLPALAIALCAPFMVFVVLCHHKASLLLVYAIPIFLNAVWGGPIHAIGQTIVKLRMRAMSAAVLMFVINLIGLGLGPAVIGILSDLLKETFGSDSLRYAMLAVLPVAFWSAYHYWIGARSLRADLAAARS